MIYKMCIPILLMLLSLTSCEANKSAVSEDEIWKIQFDTAKGAGVCYYAYNEPIVTKEGHLTFQNRNDFAVHLLVYNNKRKGKVVYEADIDAGGILSYNNMEPNDEYSVGVRVVDGKGRDTVTVMVYGNSKLLPYVLANN